MKRHRNSALVASAPAWQHRGVKKKSKPALRPESPGILPYEIDPQPIEGLMTFSGLPLLAEAYRALGLDEAVRRELRLKQRARGLSEAQLVEAFLLLLVAGGECVEDFKRMREEGPLEELVGYPTPSPDAALRFLYAFHDEQVLAGRPATPGTAWVPPESSALKGLFAVNQQLLQQVARLRPAAAVRTATLDHDASIIDSKKREAFRHYEGGRGYQPSFVFWAETELLVADEFRDGNVPAGAFNLPLVQRAFEALPAEVEARYFRADSACYDQAVLSYLRHAGVGFAVSADMSESLRATIAALPEKAWRPLDAGREWAEVIFVPSTALFEPVEVAPDRYIAIRKRPKQLTLWEQDGYSYWAVATNLDWPGDRVLAWHREKAGTIEHFHHVAQNELGMGILPCGRFGADAAWVRLNVLAYNLLAFLRTTVLPRPLRKARPKRLRFEVLQLAGVVIRHARKTIVRLAVAAERIAMLIEARFQLAGCRLVLTG